MCLDQTGTGCKRWTARWKAALQAFDLTFELSYRLIGLSLSPTTPQLSGSVTHPCRRPIAPRIIPEFSAPGDSIGRLA
jgi:hypothetical protein